MLQVVSLFKSVPVKVQKLYWMGMLALTLFMLNLGATHAQTPVPDGMETMQTTVTGFISDLTVIVIAIIAAGLALAGVVIAGVQGFKLARRTFGF